MQRNRLDFVNFPCTQDGAEQRLGILVSITHRNTRHRLETILPYGAPMRLMKSKISELKFIFTSLDGESFVISCATFIRN